MVDEIFQGLTPKQEEAVRTLDQNLEIVACAGAGKTKTITLRIINLIASGVKPENIVAITFTRKAAQEMKSRIYAAGEKYLGNTIGFAGMFIGTIDAFCLKMLQDYEPKYAKFSVLDEIQTKVFMEKYHTKNNDRTGFSGSVIDTANNLRGRYSKKLDIYVGMMSMLNNCYFNRSYRGHWSDDLNRRLNAFNKCLRDNKYFDYSSLIREMIECLDPNSDRNQGRMSEFARKIFDKVKYLTIDEYQDSNPPQEYLADLFYTYGHANLCVVGDADQTIYQFRGSDESNILEFADKYNAKKIHLKHDFRSTEAIVDIANQSIIENHRNDAGYERMEVGEVPESRLAYEEGDTVHEFFADFNDESDFIVERIQKLHEIGIPLSEIAVLFRKRRKNHFSEIWVDFQEELARKLKNAGIPYIVEGLNNLSNTPEYNASCEIFRYIQKQYYPDNNPQNNAFLPANTVQDNRTPEDRLKDAWLKIEEWYDVPGLVDGIEDSVDELITKNWDNIRFGNDFNMQQIYQDFICHMAFVESGDAAAEILLYNLGKFSNVIADFERMFFCDSADFKAKRFISHLNLVADGLYPEGEEDNAYIRTDAVRLMTIHQSKGLEFTAVFIPALAQSIFPGSTFLRKPGKIYGPIDAIDEFASAAGGNGADWVPNHDGFLWDAAAERKMFYVAVTRAKKYLFLSYSVSYDPGDGLDRETEESSEFLDEICRSDYVKEFDETVDYTTDCLPLIEGEVIPITLNFSLLSNYFDCPYRFKLSNFYGFVQPYTTAQGYGKMLHEIMMHIHREWIEGNTLTHEQIDKIAEDALYLPFASETQIRTSLEGAKSCAQAYVAQNAADADKMIAAELDINIEMGDGISVNGRIDLVRKIEEDGKESVAIVDLKSAGKDAEQCLNAEQLKIYALGYAQMVGKSADYLMIYNLDEPDGSKNAKEEIRQDAIDQVQVKIKSAAEHIRNSDLPRCVGAMCEKCYVKGLCRRA